VNRTLELYDSYIRDSTQYQWSMTWFLLAIITYHGDFLVDDNERRRWVQNEWQLCEQKYYRTGMMIDFHFVQTVYFSNVYVFAITFRMVLWWEKNSVAFHFAKASHFVSECGHGTKREKSTVCSPALFGTKLTYGTSVAPMFRWKVGKIFFAILEYRNLPVGYVS
jgi:hypothetical protein